MQGRRLLPKSDGTYEFADIRAGDYFIDPTGGWDAMTPDGRLCNLRDHKVTEHDDGTITVAPSILVSGGGRPGSWHGFLERGVWREC